MKDLADLIPPPRLPDDPDQRAKIVAGDDRLLAELVVGKTVPIELTDREYQVMRRLCDGDTPAEIADALTMSVGLVRTTMLHARIRLRARTTAQATAILTRLEWEREHAA